MQQEVLDQITLLTSDKIGKVVYQGLAAVYDTKPDYPVTYLANWLLNHCVTKTSEEKYKTTEETRVQLTEKHKQTLQDTARVQKEQEKVIEATVQAEANFREVIEKHQYLEELVPQEFPDFINRTLNLPASYIGYFGYPLKEIAEDDEEPNAHLDTTQEKLLRYIGASKNQKNFIIGQKLLPETGVTYDVLKPKEEEEQAEPEGGEGEEGEEGVVRAPKPKYLYIPDVTKEPRMVYFRIPRLGAYISMSLTYKSSLNEQAFDEGVKERQRVQVERGEQQKEKDAKEAEYQEKLEEAQDDGRSINGIEEEWRNMQWDEINEKEFEYVPQEYVLCADTLGEDREIPEETRAHFEELAKFFVNCWEQSEAKQLSNDIDLQIKYLSDFRKDDYLDELNNKVDDEIAEKNQEQDEEDGEESELKTKYKESLGRTEAYKKALLDEEIKNYLIGLKEYRVVKFQGIIQTALIMIGYTKEFINQPNTNLLNWKKVKYLLNDPDFFDKIKTYQYKGPKPGKLVRYALTNRVLKRLDGYNIEEVDDYNIGLGVLYRFMKQALETRIMDVEVRKVNKERKRAKREQIIQDVENLKADKAQAFEEARVQQQTELEEDEEFNWEEWEAEWDRQWEEENPPIVIPDEVEDDIDEDIEVEMIATE